MGEHGRAANGRGRGARRGVVAGGISLLAGLAYAATAAAGAGGGSAPAVERAGSARVDGQRQVVLITGSTDGLGREVARRVAATGAHVLVHGRSRERGLELVAEIERGGGSARFYQADLASLAQVRDLAAAVLRDHDRLDVLVNNAGIWRASERGRELSADGHELHFAVNYLSGYLLTRLLLPRLVESAPARVVNVASAAQRPIDFGDVMLERGYSPGEAYAQSKLAQVLFTVDLARELEGTGVAVVALHPATLMDTPMVQAAGARPRSTVAEGAEALMSLIVSPAVESGRYFDGLRAARAHDQAYDPDAHARLRRLSDRLAGLEGGAR